MGFAGIHKRCAREGWDQENSRQGCGKRRAYSFELHLRNSAVDCKRERLDFAIAGRLISILVRLRRSLAAQTPGDLDVSRFPRSSLSKNYFYFKRGIMWLPPRSNEFIRFVSLFCIDFTRQKKALLSEGNQGWMGVPKIQSAFRDCAKT